MENIVIVLLAAFTLAFPMANSSSSSLSSPSRVAVDVESLLALKKSISHDPSHVLQNWNNVLPNSLSYHPHSHCNWTGITCSSRHPGRVVSLNLANSALQGTIFPQIGNLSFLHYLHLSINAFTGVIPPTIGNLHKLKVLDVSFNSLCGILPPQLGRLKNLQMLSAYDNRLSGNIPTLLHNCSKLEVIDLSYNNLSGNIPKGIGSLTQLNFLSVGNNSLTGNIEESIQNSTSLEILTLVGNRFGGVLPSWIGKLSKLKEIHFSENIFSGTIPPNLGNCTSLEIIELSFNNLHGTIPSSLGMLPNMIGLFFSDNHIESGITHSYQPIPILQALSNCSKLHNLDLSNNKLEGTLPSVLPKNLEELCLHENQISGNIPPSIGNLSKLTFLTLGNNNLKGSIPPTIGCTKSLQLLDLSNNWFEGTIPEEMFSLNKSLYYVSLYSNRLSGSIPKSIGKLSSLHKLDLSYNSFSGTIPHELGNCTVLESLALSSNNLSGEIPREVANLRNIQFNFSLSNNKLSGNVPPEIAGLQMALYIDLSNNDLSGQIGLYMTGWLNVEHVNLAFNNFSGSLPHSFGRNETEPSITISGREPSPMYHHSVFQLSNFSYNNFEGRISCHGFFKNLTHSSFLHNPRLCGKCMGLPDCGNTSAKHTNSHFYNAKWFAIIAVVVGLFSMLPLCYLLFFKKMKQQRLNMEEPLNNQCRGVSKEELETATNNFSRANLVGTGNYGSVYNGVLQSGEMVAVKIFDIVNRQISNASFTKECQTLGKVCHKNLTKIITVCCEDNFRAIVLPLMTKGNLYDLLHERDMEGLLTPITLEMRMNIISELAGALSYLHHSCTPSIVHCDVKPQNVFLDNDMVVKLTDFGIAKLMGTNPESATLSLKGSNGYIAPEYGPGGNWTSKGDVYSFGVVILGLMTRRTPTDDMFSANLSMLEWVSMALAAVEDNNKEKLKSILEIANCNEEDLERMERVIKLGIVCCNQDPLQRPTMREVENLLSMFVGSDAGQRRTMPNLDDIGASLQASRG